MVDRMNASHGLPGSLGMNWTEEDKLRDPKGWTEQVNASEFYLTVLYRKIINQTVSKTILCGSLAEALSQADTYKRLSYVLDVYIEMVS